MALSRGARGYLDMGDGQIHFRQAGEGPPLFLIHQAPGSSAMWDALLPPLAARGRRAIALDLPGFGMSDPPASPPDLEHYARRVAMAAEALGIPRFDIVGHHTGASIALWLAVAEPRRVRRMVMYGLPLLPAAKAARLAEEAAPVYDADGAEIMAWWRRITPFLPQAKAAALLPRYAADMLLAGARRAEAHHAVGRGDHAAKLHALAVPTLAVQGRRDVLFEATRNAAALSPMIEWREFGDAGIFVADEDPEGFVALVDGFLAAAGAGEAA